MREFDEMKLARVIDACDGVDGRVKMQKIVYLLKVIGFDLPFDDFVIRQQGPFSRDVAWATDTLKGTEILYEQIDELGVDRDGTPIRQYSYQVRPDIVALIRRQFDVPAPVGRPELDVLAPRLKRYDRATLEVAATRIFLEREGLAGPALESELRRLKGHLAGEFAAAERLLDDLRQDALL